MLHAQAIRLSRERLGDFIRLEEYAPGKRLSLLYWRDLSSPDNKHTCKLVIEIDGTEPSKPLQVSHHPELGLQETLAANDAIKSDHLSIEKLLIHTVHERAKQSLTKLKAQLDELKSGETIISGCPTILSVAFIKPCTNSERLLVSVDQLTGVFLAHIPQHEECALTNKFANVVKDLTKIRPWLRELRIWLLKERCKKTAEMLPVYVTDSLPLLPGKPHHAAVMTPIQKLYFQFSKHHSKYLVKIITQMTQSSIN